MRSLLHPRPGTTAAFLLFVSIAYLSLALAFNIDTSSTRTLPNTYIVEFEAPPQSFETVQEMKMNRQSFFRRLDERNIFYHVRQEYELMNAVSIQFDKPENAYEVSEMPEVLKMWPVNLFTRPNVIGHPGRIIPNLHASHNLTGVNLVHEKLGLTGSRIKVGVIDTGIDYTHPALGGCYKKPGCRILWGHDFVGDDYDGTNDPSPDDDPLDQCNGHGTHVSGIIGANDIAKGFVGVAPDVTFGAYRIFGCNGTSPDDIIMKAMEMAYKDEMDVINLSLGDPGWPESATAALGDKLVTHWGMSVSASAGNDGSKGTFELSAPSVGKNVISVASVDNLCLLAFVARTASGRLIKYVTENDKALNISTGVVTTLDPNNTPNLALDGCTPTTKDLTGKVALIKRGGCLFITKITTAWEAGAIAVLIFNNAPGIEAPSVPDNITIEVAGISASDGATILAEIQQGGPQGEVVFNFTEEEIEFPNPTAGTISSFSSWGLSAELDIKPDISAPGGHIFSTFPLALGGYATLSGTSMSSPQIAGVIALVLQANSDKNQISPLKIRDILLNTARPVPMYQTNTTDSVAHQGSGLVNVYDAILSKTVITPSKLELNDTAHLAFRNVYNFTISNNGDGEAIFSFDNAPAGTVKVYNQSGFFPLEKPIVGIENSTDGDLDLGVASVVFPMQSFIIPANQSANISISIFPPPVPKLDRPVIYSGYITILRTENTSDAYTTTNASTLVRVPYAGISSQLRDLPILNRNAIFPTVTTPYGNPLTNASSTSFVFNSSHPAIVLYQLASPTRLLFIDAVDARNTSHSFGLIPDGLETFLGRNDPQDETDFQQVSWSGKVGLDYTTLVSEPLPGGIELLANKTKLLPAGKYRLVVRALKGFGNQTDFVDYDTWRSPVLAVGGK